MIRLPAHPRRAIVLLVVTAMLLGAHAFASAGPQPPAKVDPFLAGQMASASSSQKLLVFVHGNENSLAVSAVRNSGMTLINDFKLVSVAVGVGTPDQIRKAGTQPGVTYLEGDRPIKLDMTTSHIATRGELARTGFTVSNTASAGVDGTGITVAIIDTGIDGTHPMFMQGGVSKVVGNYKLVCHQVVNACVGPQGNANDDVFVDVHGTTNDSDTASLGGHGTHVASTVAGYDAVTQDGRHLHGAAPGAKLVGLSVGQTLSVYGGSSGMNWVLEHHAQPCGPSVSAADCPPIRVINNSWGATGEYSATATISLIQDALVNQGVVVAWSAGNGDETNDGGDGSDNRLGSTAQSPTPGVIAVANFNDGNSGSRDGDLDSSSSRGDSSRPLTWPDISAPGSSITAACRPYLWICATPDTADPNYGTISGTSMASPHIAGIVAQLLQAGPLQTPAEIEDVIEDTAYKFVNPVAYATDTSNTDNTSSFDKGHGLVDVAAAVARIRSMTAPDGTVCTANGPVSVDAQGDATQVFGFETPAENEPTLDIREGRIAWSPGPDATTTVVTFEIDLSDLQPDPDVQAGYYFNFRYDNRPWYVNASTVNGGDFSLGRVATLREGVIGGLGGTFDYANDRILIYLTNADLARASVALAAETPPLAAMPLWEDGRLLHDFSLLTNREVEVPGAVTFTPVADEAGGLCPYTLGVGAIPVVIPPPPPPAPDATITVSDPTYQWSGETITDNDVIFTDCSSTPLVGATSDQTCDTRKVNVVVPTGSTNTVLDVTVTVNNPDVNDYDLYVYKPNGDELDNSAESGTPPEHIRKTVTQSGVYTILVRAWLSVEGQYEGIAVLSTDEAMPPPPPPPPPGDVDGTIGMGESYTWEGDPLLDFNPFLTCNAPADAFCDVETIQVNVPTSTANLVISINADFEGDDFDVYIYAPNGTRTNGAAVGNEAVTISNPLSGVWKVGVKAWLAPLGTYSGTASLTSP